MQKRYLLIVFIGIFILMLLPLLFYMPKFTKNSSVFDPVSPKYITIEVRTTAMTPQDIELIHAGDIQKDNNGEENARIISVLGAEHGVVGTALLENGKRIRVISEKKAATLLIRVRYNNIENVLTLHPSNIELLTGRAMSMTFADPRNTRKYDINFRITQVDVREDKNP